MVRPTMHRTYRRNESWANAKWGELSVEPSPIHRRPLELKSNKRESSKIRPKWIQNQKDMERVGSLLMIGTAIHMRNQRKSMSYGEDRFLPIVSTKSIGSISRNAIRKSKGSSSSDKLKWNQQIREAKALLREQSHGRIPLVFSQDLDLGKLSKHHRHNYMANLKKERKSQLKLNSVFDRELAGQTSTELCLQGLELLKNIQQTSNTFYNNSVPKEIVLVPQEDSCTTLDEREVTERIATRILGSC